MPSPAMDLFKPKICIIFVVGDPNESPSEFSKKHGFSCISSADAPAKLPALVNAGQTKFLITGMKADEIQDFEVKVVECDALLNYNTTLPVSVSYIDRGRRVHRMESNETIESVLRERNLV